MSPKPRLVVVPSDPISAYEKAGYDWLQRYYNPSGYFGEVIALSPREKKNRQAHGMSIRRVSERYFRSALREIAPDVVRAYGGYWPADLVARNRLPNVPVVVSVHDRLAHRIHRSVTLADAVLCMSQAVSQAVRLKGVGPEKAVILPNRVDLNRFQPLRHTPECHRIRKIHPGKLILHVGRKHEEKNLDTLICSLSHLPKEYRCVFIGNGDVQSYQALARSEGVADRCYWLDHIQNRDLPYWYSACDCFCVPSRWEGFGIVFIEAAACGAPIVTSRIPPMTEYLRHGESAFLVEEYEDPRCLAESIHRTVDDAAFAARIRTGAQAAALPFELSEVDAMEVQIYQQVMHRHLGSPPSTWMQQRWNAEQFAYHAIRSGAKHVLGLFKSEQKNAA